MRRRIVTLFLVVVIVILQVLPAYAEPIEYDGKMIDWIYDWAKRNNTVAKGRYLYDLSQDIAAQSGNGVDGALTIMEQVTNDFLDNMHWNDTTGLQAIRNTFFGLPKRTQDNITNVYNEYKDTNIVISPEIAAELQINLFNQSLLNQDVMIINQPSQELRQGVMTDLVYTQGQFRDDLASGALYPYGGDIAISVADNLKKNAAKYANDALGVKYFYFFTYYNINPTTGNPMRTGHSVRSNNPNISGVNYYVPSGGWAGHYVALYIPGSTSPSVGTRVWYTYDSSSMYMPSFSLKETGFYSYYDMSTSYRSLYPWESSCVRITFAESAAVADVVNNYTTNIYDQTQNHYDYSTIQNYYTNEYVPASNTNNYYTYVTPRNNDTTVNNSVNNEYSTVINNNIYNNNYNGSDETTNVTYVTVIPNYQPESTPEPIIPTDPPIASTDPPITPTPKPDTEIPKPPEEGGSLWDWLFDVFKIIGDILAGIFDFIVNFFDKLKEFIIGLLTDLLTVEDDYMTNKITGYKDTILEKADVSKGFEQIMGLEEKEFGDIRGGLGAVQSFSEGMAYDGTSPVQNRNFFNIDSSMTFVDFSYFRDNQSVFREWFDGFFSLLLFFYNLNQFLFLIRGTYLFKTTGKGDG